MQAGLAAIQKPWCWARFVLCLDRRLVPFLHARFAMFAGFATLLLSSLYPAPGYCVEARQPNLQRLFHIVGIPGLRRDQRVDLTLDADGLSFQTSKVQYQVPYGRIRHVLVLSSDRRYEGRTYAAALATYGAGAFLILKKHHVDTVVVDYVNERGGKMGIVLQMETSQGEVLRNLLRSREVSVDEPEAAPELSKQDTYNGNTDRSKQ
jgi:hypothetical protein